jgi:hypothetical protein
MEHHHQASPPTSTRHHSLVVTITVSSWIIAHGLKDGGTLIRLKRIYNFLCSMLVYVLFALCFVTLHGVFMHFLELTY